MRVVIPDDLLESIDAVGGIPDRADPARRAAVPVRGQSLRGDPYRAPQAGRRRAGVAEFEDYESRTTPSTDSSRRHIPTLKPPEIAVLAAIEALIVEAQKRRKAEADKAAAAGKPETAGFDGFSVTAMKARFTYDTLAARAQIKSRNTLSKRIKALKRAEAIKVTVEHSGFGLKASTWELLVPAAQAVTAAKYGRFMPDPVNVLELLHDPVTRRKRLDQILAENGALPDWQHDGAGSDDSGSSNRAANEGEDEADGEDEVTDEPL